MPLSAAIFGSTGLTGKNILAVVAGLDSFSSIHTISRRQPFTESARLSAKIEADLAQWPASLSSIAPTPDVVFSALGTTSSQAGGVKNQWKIDHDLNIEIAKAAKKSGVKTYVFISSAGIRGFPASMIPYSKMKIGVEDAIKDLGFEHAIILRPGGILGEREGSRPTERIMDNLFNGLGRISPGLRDSLGQDADVIAKAAVHAATLASEGKAPSKYWVVDSAEVLRLGRDEWKQ